MHLPIHVELLNRQISSTGTELVPMVRRPNKIAIFPEFSYRLDNLLESTPGKHFGKKSLAAQDSQGSS